jgi:Protein of unknown function (DUF3040)
VDDGHPCDDVTLSPRERLALRGIEAELGSDRRLARRMRRPVPRLCEPAALTVLACASVFLAAMGISTSAPAYVWSFAVVWPCTLLTVLRLLCRATRPGGPTTTPWV